MTVLCDSLQEPLTFTCNCKSEGRRGGLAGGGAGSLGHSSHPTVGPRAALGGWLWDQLFRSKATFSSPKLLSLVGVVLGPTSPVMGDQGGC